MAIEYIPIMIITGLAAFVGVFVVIAGHALGPRRPTKEKGQAYESGMVPYGEGARRIPIRYYLVAVLFILFDIELVFFIPWAVVFRRLGIWGLIEMFVFIAVLVVGYIYAWKKGALEWD